MIDNNNTEIVSQLFQLLKDEHFTQAHDLIHSSSFDVNAINENGTSLLLLALLKEQYKIAESLLSLGADINTENYHGQFALSARAGSLKGFKRNLQVFDKCGVMPEMTLERFDTLIGIHTNRNSATNQMNHIKLIFERFGESIATFDPLAVQEILSHSSNQEALHYYQTLISQVTPDASFENNQAFLFLRKVIDNVEDYFDYYSVEGHEDTAKVQTLKDLVQNIQHQVADIKSPEAFHAFFRENESSSNFSHLCEKMLSVVYTDDGHTMHHSDYFKHPVIEMLNVYRAISQTTVNYVDDQDFTEKLLSHWSHHYFEGKVNINASHNNQVPENLRKELNTVLNIYGLNSVLLTKDKPLAQGIENLKEYLEEVLHLFPMERHMVGNNQLNVVIHHTNLGHDSSRPTNGLYQNDIHTVSVNADQIHRKRIQTFLHEYTHYMQGRPFEDYDDYQTFFNETREEVVEDAVNEAVFQQNVFSQQSHELQAVVTQNYAPVLVKSLPSQFEDAIQSYEDFTVQDLANYFSRYVVCSFGEEHEATIHDLSQAILPVLSEWNNTVELSALKGKLNHVMVPVLNTRFLASAMTSDNFVYDYLDTYQQFTEQKDFSFDYLLWSKLDNNKRPYWTQTVEIHARMNEALILDKIGVPHNLVSPLKFEKIKDMIHSFNRYLVEKSVEYVADKTHKCTFH